MGFIDFFKSLLGKDSVSSNNGSLEEVRKELNSLSGFKKEINSNSDIYKHRIVGGTLKASLKKKYEEKSDFYECLLETLEDHWKRNKRFDIIKSNVYRIKDVFSYRSTIIEEFGKEMGSKIILEGVFKGMSEKMFKSHQAHKLANGFPVKLIGHAIEEKSNNRGIMKIYTPSAPEFHGYNMLVFENDKLISISIMDKNGAYLNIDKPEPS